MTLLYNYLTFTVTSELLNVLDKIEGNLRSGLNFTHKKHRPNVKCHIH